MIENDMVQQVLLAAEKAKAAGFLKTYDAMLAVATEIINDAYDVSGEDHPPVDVSK